ncbi:MAG: PorV/PorQ family protein [Armatimonadota bacterium]|nr:PorV/PorQ family protein [Armatimonadota bacterium]
MRTLNLAALLVLAAQAGWAAETAAFLDIGVGARAVGMGGAYTALADDANAVYWNPAGLARMEKREASVSHAELGASTRHDFLAYAHPAPQGTFAGAFTYLSQGSIEGRDGLGRPTGSFNASDAAVAGAYGRKTDFADLGVSVKYLRSHIGSAEAQGAALDLGARRELEGLGSGKLALGAALRNLGPGLKYDRERNDLPLRLALGAAYRLPKGHAVAVEFQNGPRGTGSEGAVGGEFKAMEGVFLRLGYATKGAASGGAGFNAAKGLTLGLGLKRGQFSLDYGAQAAGELGNTHRFSLAVRW